MEVIPGVHRLKVPIPDNPLGFLNAYLFRSGGSSLLVDTGWNTDEAFDSLSRQLEEAGVPFAGLRYIAVTHAHPDHYGLVKRLAPLTGGRLVMHKIELAFLRARDRAHDTLPEEMDGWLGLNGVPIGERPQVNPGHYATLGLVSAPTANFPVRGGEHLDVGEFDLEVLWTPGHSAGHICFFERRRRVLVSGDHVLPGITPNVSLYAESMGNPLADYLGSLQAVEKLAVDIVLPSHGEPFQNLRSRTTEIRDHHEERKTQVLAALTGEGRTAYEVASMIPWNTKGVPWKQLSPWLKREAVAETLAHLELLRAEGAASRLSKYGIFRYQHYRTSLSSAQT